MDVLLSRHVAGDPVRARMRAGNRLDVFGSARDEGDASAAAEQLADDREAQSGRAARDGDPRAVEGIPPVVGSVMCHDAIVAGSTRSSLPALGQGGTCPRGQGITNH